MNVQYYPSNVWNILLFTVPFVCQTRVVLYPIAAIAIIWIIFLNFWHNSYTHTQKTFLYLTDAILFRLALRLRLFYGLKPNNILQNGLIFALSPFLFARKNKTICIRFKLIKQKLNICQPRWLLLIAAVLNCSVTANVFAALIVD